jgi:hypothetical protein
VLILPVSCMASSRTARRARALAELTSTRALTFGERGSTFERQTAFMRASQVHMGGRRASLMGSTAFYGGLVRLSSVVQVSGKAPSASPLACIPS